MAGNVDMGAILSQQLINVSIIHKTLNNASWRNIFQQIYYYLFFCYLRLGGVQKSYTKKCTKFLCQKTKFQSNKLNISI